MDPLAPELRSDHISAKFRRKIDDRFAHYDPFKGSLDLSYCGIDSSTITNVVTRLRCLDGLMILCVSGNSLGDAGAKAIAESLTELTTLHIDGNLIGETGARAISESLTTLIALRINNNSIRDAGVIVNLLERLTPTRFPGGMLLDISVQNNPLTWSGRAPISDAVLWERSPARLLAALLEARDKGITISFARAVTAGTTGAGKTHLSRRFVEPDNPVLNGELALQEDGDGKITIGVRRRETTLDPAALAISDLQPIRLVLQDVGGHREQIKAHFHLVYLAGQAIFMLCIRMDEQINAWPRYYLYLLADLSRRAYGGKHGRRFFEHELRGRVGLDDMLTVVVVPTHADRVVDHDAKVAEIRAMCSNIPALRIVVCSPVNNLKPEDAKRVMKLVAHELKNLPQVVTTVQGYIPAIRAEVDRRFERPAPGSGQKLKVSLDLGELREICNTHGADDVPYVVRELLRLGVVMTPLNDMPLRHDDPKDRVRLLINPMFLNEDVYTLLMDPAARSGNGFMSEAEMNERTRGMILATERALVRDILQQYLVVFDYKKAGEIDGFLIPDQFETRPEGTFEPWADACVHRRWNSNGFVPEHVLFELMASNKNRLLAISQPTKTSAGVYAYRDACLFVEGPARVQVYLNVLTRSLEMHGHGDGADQLISWLFTSIRELTESEWTADVVLPNQLERKSLISKRMRKGNEDHVMSNAANKIILFLASNPKDTHPLRLDEEMREIDEGLRRGKCRESFRLAQRWAVRAEDLRRGLLDEEPVIVHFSGHGSPTAGLVCENGSGKAETVPPDALAELFALCANHVECVVLNSCYSEEQATAIARHIPYVVGMAKAIGDSAAIRFAVGFYDAVGAGRSYDDAFKFGCNAISLDGLSEQETPQLKRRANS